MATKTITDRDIERLYDSAEYRITQQKNDFLLPQIFDLVNRREWLNLRPEYQRRLVWPNKKKSLLIESLLMNVPIPPVFLYEHDLGRYEVMDGQQRLSAIIEFYDNRLKLGGLEKWSILNGRTYADCPPRIQKGFDRRTISATILLAESTVSKTSSDDLRVLVFERLNTGGINLNNQELRNCLYSGPFNDLIVDLAGNSLFNDIWDIPRYEDHIRGDHISKELMANTDFKRMRDCEMVLRFFAFRQAKSRIRGAVKKILDSLMRKFSVADSEELAQLRETFISRLELSYQIFGDGAFSPTLSESRADKSVPLYDAVMVALDRMYEHRELLLANRASIRSNLVEELVAEDAYALITAKANTAASILARQKLVEDVLRAAIE